MRISISRGSMTFWIVITILCGAGASERLAAQSATRVPSDSELRNVLADFVDVQHRATGIVVGITSPAGDHIITYGRATSGASRPLDGTTLFEIGSLTKVFTALLLSDAVERHEVALSDAVSRYLPNGWHAPTFGDSRITLVDLATHTAGLPMTPPDLDPTSPTAYATFTTAQLVAYLSKATLTQSPGSKWSYSNLGYSILATALANEAHASYETLLSKRVLSPLALAHTSTAAPTDTLAPLLAQGYDERGNRAPRWLSPTLPGMGDMRSSANDLLAFLDAFLGRRDVSPTLAHAMQNMLQTRRAGPGFEQALGWWVIKLTPDDSGVVLFGGQTWGYHSTAAFDPRTKIGVVVLSNSPADDAGLALHVLRPVMPVQTSTVIKASQHAEIALDSVALDRYVGHYAETTGDTITITQSGGALTMQSKRAPQPVTLHAQTDTTFFLKEVDMTITFGMDASHRATHLAIHFAGRVYDAVRY